MHYTDLVEITLLLLVIVLVWRRSKPVQKTNRVNQKIILDSCALIDGRIVAITEAGFAAEEIIIPQFIVRELQMLADGHDSHKRERARFGLDIAQQLQADPVLTVTIDPSSFDDIPKTDDKLVALAKKLKARLYTTDYNLNKVAVLEGVQVLNVNELAQTLRPDYLPGEVKQVKVIQKGQGRDQGVGYFEDGTMVVVDGASRAIGKTLTVTVERMHQTVAGKMAFAKIKKST